MAMGAVAIHYMSTWKTLTDYIWLMKKVTKTLHIFPHYRGQPHHKSAEHAENV
jgi:hypothetical protein